MTPSKRHQQSRVHRFLAGAAALVALTAVPALAGPVPEAGAAGSAAGAAACVGSSGVTVVVDFGALGGVQVGCAAGDPASGLAALSGAGFGYTFVPRQQGLVCTINGRPDPCNGAPTSAYWSYWHARPGGSWTYSSIGAGSYNPVPGSVEGWSFGAGSAPGIAPPNVPAPPPPPAPQPPPGTQPPRNPPASPPAPGQPAPGQPAQTAPGAPSQTVPVPGATSSSPASSSESPSPTTTSSDDQRAAPVAKVDDSGGGTFGLITAVALIAVLAALALWRARSRRRSAEP